MARYDYACPSCGTRFEVEHHMNEHPEVRCPNCGAVCQQVFSASAIVFKGAGFYNTDMRGSSSATPASTAGGTSTAASEPKAAGGASAPASAGPAAASSPSPAPAAKPAD